MTRPHKIRPLRRIDLGIWCSRDERWTFLRHFSDPHPQRWFTYEHGESYPAWMEGHPSLRDAVSAVQEEVKAK